jgi:hypothetical protein
MDILGSNHAISIDHLIGHFWLISIELVLLLNKPCNELGCDALQTACPSSILSLQSVQPIRHTQSTLRQLFEDDWDDGVCPSLVACKLNCSDDFLLLIEGVIGMC